MREPIRRARVALIAAALLPFLATMPGSAIGEASPWATAAPGAAVSPPSVSGAPSCWVRGEALTVDWIAARDATYRDGPYSQRVLERTADGWTWERREDADGAGDMLPGADLMSQMMIDTSLAPARLEVREGSPGGDSEARFVEGAMGPGSPGGTTTVRWTTPPERICSDEALDLRVRVEVSDGTPAPEGLTVILPLPEEWLQDKAPEVSACNSYGGVRADARAGQVRVEGRCRRTLEHLTGSPSWDLRLNLPDTFSLIYPYRAEAGS